MLALAGVTGLVLMLGRTSDRMLLLVPLVLLLRGLETGTTVGLIEGRSFVEAFHLGLVFGVGFTLFAYIGAAAAMTWPRYGQK